MTPPSLLTCDRFYEQCERDGVKADWWDYFGYRCSYAKKLDYPKESWTLEPPLERENADA